MSNLIQNPLTAVQQPMMPTPLQLSGPRLKLCTVLAIPCISFSPKMFLHNNFWSSKYLSYTFEMCTEDVKNPHVTVFLTSVILTKTAMSEQMFVKPDVFLPMYHELTIY